MRARHRFFRVFTVAFFVGGSTSVGAQTSPSLDVRTWRAPTDPRAGLTLEPATTPGPGLFSVGGFLNYAYRPVTLRDSASGERISRPLEHVLGLDAVFNLGIGERFALGASAPLFLAQSGSGSSSQASQETGAPLPTTGIGDIAITTKSSLIRNEDGGFGLAAIGHIALPSGDRASFMGEGAPTVTARMIAEYTLLIASAQVGLGYQARTVHRTWPADGPNGVRFGDVIPWHAGVTMRPGILGIDADNRQRWELSVRGSLPAGPVGPFGAGSPGSAALSPVLLGASSRIELGHYRDSFFTVGGDIGLNEAVGVPAVRAMTGLGWAPRAHDIDHDGIPDDIDGCPEIPEDKDGFEDSDGCPDSDNDDDGVLDGEDACRNVKGQPSSDPTKNGCPLTSAAGSTNGTAPDHCVGVSPSDAAKKGCFMPENAIVAAPFDTDTDADGIVDADDACPNVRGDVSTDPSRNGCPNADRDGDTFDNDVDRCPEVAEVWNGIDDNDGCPDEGGKPLLTIDEKRAIRVARPIELTGPPDAPDVAEASVPTLRAIAQELNLHRDWTLAVGVRPETGTATSQGRALAKSLAIVRVLATFSHRDGVAETVGWNAVQTQPRAAQDLAFLIMSAYRAKPASVP